jgi:hypothetical protein
MGTEYSKDLVTDGAIILEWKSVDWIHVVQDKE